MVISPLEKTTDLERVKGELTNLAPSTYVVRIDAAIGGEWLKQQVAFTVSQ
jgi:hypothetical protein